MSLRGMSLVVLVSLALAGCHLIFKYEDEPSRDGAAALDQAPPADKKVPPMDRKVPPADRKVPPMDKAPLPPDLGKAICGDGVKQPGEPCDYANPLSNMLPDAACRPSCSLSYCGDGIVDQGKGEQCDSITQSWCSSSCTLVTPSLLAPEPPGLHFGAVGLGCANSVNRTLYVNNPSAKSIVLKDYVTDGCLAGSFTLGSGLKGQTIGPGARKPITVTFKPSKTGIVSCAMVLTDDDGSKAVVPLTVNVTNKATHTDYFLQDNKRPVDLLMLVDNSGSMMDQKVAVEQSAAPLASAALKHKTDLHLGVVYMKEGSVTLRGAMYGSPAYLTAATVSEAKIKSRLPVSYASSDKEEGFGVITAALNPPLSVDVARSCGSGCPKGSACVGAVCQGVNKGFRRAHADLALMVFLDEDDQTSTISATQFVEAMQKQVNPLLGQIVRVQALLDMAKCNPAKSLSSYPKWSGVITKHSGDAKDICDASLATYYDTLATAVMGPRRWFRLTRPRSVSAGSMKVVIDGTTVKDVEYAWKDGGNGILLNNPPAHGAVIQVSYAASCP